MEERQKHQKKNKSIQKAAGLGFMVVLAAFLVANAVTKDREFSEKENRSLQQEPALTFSNVISGKFMQEYESYQSDQFVARDLWVSVKSNLSLLAGERESAGIFKGKDHYLLEDIKAPLEKSFEANLKAMKDFEGTYEEIPMYVCLVPNAANVLEEKLPAFAETKDQDAQLDEVKETLGSGFTWVDMKEPLEEHKDEDIFYKTDHHWTTLGAYYGFMAFAKEAGLDTTEVEKMEPYAVTTLFNGTLSAVSGYEPGYTEPIYIYYSPDMPEAVSLFVQQQQKSASWYDSDKLNNREKYDVFLSGNYPLIDIRTTSTSEDVLLVVKDSYANCFLPFLAEGYKEIVVVDPRYYYGSIGDVMSNYSIDQVLFLYNMNTFVEDKNISGALEIGE